MAKSAMPSPFRSPSTEQGTCQSRSSQLARTAGERFARRCVRSGLWPFASRAPRRSAGTPSAPSRTRRIDAAKRAEGRLPGRGSDRLKVSSHSEVAGNRKPQPRSARAGRCRFGSRRQLGAAALRRALTSRRRHALFRPPEGADFRQKTTGIPMHRYRTHTCGALRPTTSARPSACPAGCTASATMAGCCSSTSATITA